MLRSSFIDQQNALRFSLKRGQEAEDVVFALAGQKSLVFCYRQGHPAAGAIYCMHACVYAMQFIRPLLKQRVLLCGLFHMRTSSSGLKSQPSALMWLLSMAISAALAFTLQSSS